MTVPHLSSSETTAQLSARFGYAAAMKSINNLLLLGDGETWNRQKVDFAGLPEMVRTFLQVAAGAADIPVTRLLGQSPAGLSATGDSDTRNYYDMVSARQEADLRPTLERLDRLIARSEGLDPGALTFDFRPLWQLDAATAATVALQKAQATQIYAGLNLWPAAVTARLVAAQLAEDGTYPNAEATFAEATVARSSTATLDFDPDQPRDPDGRWTSEEGAGSAPPAIVPVFLRTVGGPEGGSASASEGVSSHPSGQTLAQEFDPEEENRRENDPLEREPGDVLLLQRYDAAAKLLLEIDPRNQALETFRSPGEVPSENEVRYIEQATRAAFVKRVVDFLTPNGESIGEEGTRPSIREMPGGLPAAQRDFEYLKLGGTDVPFAKGSMVRLPYGAATITFRPISSTPGSPAIDVNIPGPDYYKLHY